jgi:hypothetical protein
VARAYGREVLRHLSAILARDDRSPSAVSQLEATDGGGSTRIDPHLAVNRLVEVGGDLDP